MVSVFFRQSVPTEHSKEDRYELLECIGEGTYGKVYKARIKASDDPTIYALKAMKLTSASSDGLTMAACREIALLRELKHENVIRAKEIFMSKKSGPCLLFDYAEYDLWAIGDYYRKKQPVTSPPEALQKSLIWQILNGIHYLHSNWVLHRDLKPANILVMGAGPELGCVKIADLGMARIFQSPLKSFVDVDAVVVTYWYRSPELLLGAKHYTKAIDLWAIGCIMGEVMVTKPLFVARGGDKTKAYHKEQLAAIFGIMGFPVPVAYKSVNDRHWQGMDSMPEYQRFCEDFRTEMSQSNRPVKSLDKIYPSLASNPSKLALLTGLLRIDPVQRFTSATALKSSYFTEEPLPTRNVFENSLDYQLLPVRQVLQTDKEKEAGGAAGAGGAVAAAVAGSGSAGAVVSSGGGGGAGRVRKSSSLGMGSSGGAGVGAGVGGIGGVGGSVGGILGSGPVPAPSVMGAKQARPPVKRTKPDGL
eukprot:m.138045 g.138045  ORF g.138045 m.138045 type:complete len:475 (+) comp16622_c1_seq1:498-1922(+)